MDITKQPEWKALEVHYEKVKDLHLRGLFSKDSERGPKFSLQAGDIFADYSKNRITEETVDLLLDLAKAANLEEWRDAMFNGKKINITEDRAVLHTALRNQSDRKIMVDGQDVMPEVRSVLEHMAEFAQSVRDGSWKGYTGKSIKAVVNIGIGGQDLGMLMAYEALRFYSTRDIQFRFLSNIDPAHATEVLHGLDPETTLFIISSKTFTTDETMTNSYTARQWLLDDLKDEAAIAKHFVALSTNTEGVKAFGIEPANMFAFWDWVGGRYSLASAAGLPVMIAIGPERFDELLAGMHTMDEHFRTTPLKSNLPVLLGLIGIWYVDFFGVQSEALLPYSQYLHRFAAYLQQGNMESNGKRVTKDGQPVSYATGPVIWGEPGTNSQHSFHQLLHQSNLLIPVDFIGFSNALEDHGEHQRKLISNLLAQSQALAFGKTEDEVRAEGVAEELVPHKTFPGNRPSNTMLMPKLTPKTLGQLIALYEHKIFVQGAIWNVNSFDQWGVQLGKVLATNIYADINQPGQGVNIDSSTANLLAKYRQDS